MDNPDARLPQWWSESIQEAWDRSRDAAVSSWWVRGDHSVPLDALVLEEALAFGHGARSAYPREVSWDALCPQLREDWIGLGHVGTASWDRVAATVHHEWVRAGGPGGDATPESELHRPEQRES